MGRPLTLRIAPAHTSEVTRFRCFLASSALAFGLSPTLGCSSDDPPPATPDTGVVGDTGGDAPADTPVVKAEGTADVTLLTLTAWQGQLDPLTVTTATTATTYGGLATLSAYFKAERAATKDDVLLLTAGDEFGGTPVLSSAFDDEPAVKGLGLLGLTATTFANHNFDLGIPGLQKLVPLATYKFVSSNLLNLGKELGDKVQVPYWMTEVGAAAPRPKVAILGITSPTLLKIQFPGKVGSIEVEEQVSATNRAVKAARDAGAALVVALVHGGVDKVDGGVPTGAMVDLAKAVTGVDVFIGNNTDLQVATEVNGALLLQNKKRGQAFHVAKVKIVDGKVTSKSAVSKDAIGTVVALPPAGASCSLPTECASGACTGGKCVVSCPSTACADGFSCTAGACEKVVMAGDAAADTLLEPYRKSLPDKFDVKLAVVDQEYKRGGTPQIERIGETPLGDLLADAMLSRCAPLGAKIAMVNGGALKSALPSSYAPVDKTLRRTAVGYAAGPPYDIVLGDVFNMLPFGNAVVVRKIKGSVLWSALENGFAGLPAAVGGFPQIAGFKVVYDASAASGSRVVSVTLDDGTVIAKDDAKEIGLVTNDFINAGGDGYSMLIEPVPSPTLQLLTTVVADYLRASTPLPAPKGGRLVPKV